MSQTLLPDQVDVIDRSGRLEGHVTVDNASVAVTGTFWQATQPVSAAALPLPAGAATETSLGTDGAAPASIPGTGIRGWLRSIYDLLAATLTVNVTDRTARLLGHVTVDNASVAVTGTFWQTTQPVSAAALPLPSGASTAAKQPALGTAGSASADVLSVQGIASMTALKVDGSAVTQPVSGTFWQSTQPVSAAALPLPSGASTSAKQPALGAAGAASTDVLSVQGVVGGVAQPVSGTFFQATQPVSAAALPLPSGASTSAKQPALGTAGSASADVLSVQGVASMTALKVDGSGVTQPVSGTFWQATQPVSAASLPLPTGAATAAKQPALGTAGAASTDVLSVQGIANGVAQPVTPAPIADKTFSGTLMNASGSTVAISMEGYQGLVLHVVNSNLTASIQVKGSGDGGTTFNMPVYMGTSAIGGTPLYTQTAGIGYAADSSTLDFYVIPAEGITHYQVAFSAYTSGSTTVTPRASSVGWQFGPPVVSTDGTFDGGVGPFLRVGGQRSDNNDTYIHFNNATAPGSSDWGIITRDQANMGQSVLASAVTSPASATTVVQSSGIVTGLDKYRSLLITARLLGATGGALDVYLQASPDAGTTWFDVVHFPQVTAAAAVKGYVVQLSKGVGSGAAPAAVNGADGTPVLAVNTVAQGDWGDRLRYVFVAGASTSAGAAQTIKISGTT